MLNKNKYTYLKEILNQKILIVKKEKKENNPTEAKKKGKKVDKYTDRKEEKLKS